MMLEAIFTSPRDEMHERLLEILETWPTTCRHWPSYFCAKSKIREDDVRMEQKIF